VTVNPQSLWRAISISLISKADRVLANDRNVSAPQMFDVLLSALTAENFENGTASDCATHTVCSELEDD
jgi:hypothetical protein